MRLPKLSKPKGNELPIPDTAQGDPNAVELFRGWVADGGLHVSLRVDVWDDAGMWGIALADLVRHVANTYHQQKGFDRAMVVERIKALLDAEFESPTDEPTGRIIK